MGPVQTVTPKKPEHRNLGLRGDHIESGYARFIVERPEGADDLLLRSAIVTAADIAAISAVRARLDDTQMSNGSAELHFSFIGPPPEVCTVDARVIQWSDYAAHLRMEARTPDGELAATALTTMSLRPVPPGGTPDSGRW